MSRRGELPPSLRVIASAVFFAVIGFGLGLLAVIPRTGGQPAGYSWLPALTMCGLGAGTGAGLGAQSERAFLLGVIGALVGVGAGLGLAVAGTDSWAVAGVVATGVTALLAVGARRGAGEEPA